MRKLIIFFGKLFFLFKSKKKTKEPKRILIMRSGGIGDVLMSTPLVKAIRKHYPKAKITYFVGNWSKNSLENNPNIDRIFNYDDLIIIKRNIIKISGLIKKIRKEKFDLGFNLEKSWHWAVLMFLFGIPKRIGFDRKGEGFANNLTVPFNGTKYELEYYLDLARLLKMKIPTDEMEIYLTNKEKIIANKFIKQSKLKNKKKIGIAPGGADNPAQQAFIKRWPLENYIRLIDKLTGKKKYVILFGGENDIEICKEIIKKIKNKNQVLNTAGKFTVKSCAAVMKKCNLFVTHDSGPMHIAAAVKVPLIALFGPTQSRRFAPKDAIIIKNKICRPCYDIYGNYKKCEKKDCMKVIEVNDVLKAIK